MDSKDGSGTGLPPVGTQEASAGSDRSDSGSERTPERALFTCGEDHGTDRRGGTQEVLSSQSGSAGHEPAESLTGKRGSGIIVPRSLIEAYENKIRDKNDQITRLARDNIDSARHLAAKDVRIDKLKASADGWRRSQGRYFGLCLLFITATIILGLMCMNMDRKLHLLENCWPVVQDPAQMLLPPTVIESPPASNITQL